MIKCLFELVLINKFLYGVPIRGPIQDKTIQLMKDSSVLFPLFGCRFLNHYSFAGQRNWGCPSRTSPQRGHQAAPDSICRHGTRKGLPPSSNTWNSQPSRWAPGPAPTHPPSSQPQGSTEVPLAHPAAREARAQAVPRDPADPRRAPAWVPAPLRGCRPLPDEQAHQCLLG